MSRNPKIAFLINPKSGGGQGESLIRELRAFTMQHGFAITVAEIDFENIERQTQLLLSAETVVIGGGDGSISSFLNKVTDLPARVGVLPLGTGNDLARELEIKRFAGTQSISEILRFYETAESKEFVLGRLEYGENSALHTSFCNYISFGFDARVVSDFSRWRTSNYWGHVGGILMNRLGYALASLRNIRYRIPGEPKILKAGTDPYLCKQVASIIFPNIRAVMGMGISNQHSSPYDDRIECLCVYNPLAYLSMLCSSLGAVFRPEFLGGESSWQIEGIPSDCLVQVDGEPRPEIQGRDFRVCAGRKIRMIVGK